MILVSGFPAICQYHSPPIGGGGIYIGSRGTCPCTAYIPLLGRKTRLDHTRETRANTPASLSLDLRLCYIGLEKWLNLTCPSSLRRVSRFLLRGDGRVNKMLTMETRSSLLLRPTPPLLWLLNETARLLLGLGAPSSLLLRPPTRPTYLVNLPKDKPCLLLRRRTRSPSLPRPTPTPTDLPACRKTRRAWC